MGSDRLRHNLTYTKDITDREIIFQLALKLERIPPTSKKVGVWTLVEFTLKTVAQLLSFKKIQKIIGIIYLNQQFYQV